VRHVTHSGDPRLARHIGNAVLMQDSRGVRITKDGQHSKRRIDAAMAALMAYELASAFPLTRPATVVAHGS
jgi:phage terminase large subunit-like protein